MGESAVSKPLSFQPAVRKGRRGAPLRAGIYGVRVRRGPDWYEYSHTQYSRQSWDHGGGPGSHGTVLRPNSDILKEWAKQWCLHCDRHSDSFEKNVTETHSGGGRCCATLWKRLFGPKSGWSPWRSAVVKWEWADSTMNDAKAYTFYYRAGDNGGYDLAVDDVKQRVNTAEFDEVACEFTQFVLAELKSSFQTVDEVIFGMEDSDDSE